ncbi:zinc-binding alcohol dehydrogenase [Acuticoccus sp. 2012]|uniref:Zinc-binding alcohol dehydrogenase n=2 Tax=Acuticoccus mangrovi TaxID=2796142 RepID=A0A934IPG2_9HYPH|nr:zinc-binding alcohol dehydrogenase [Acuticoccus mangrovi]
MLEGRVPASETERMRCPHQEGEFPFPVKYGYALVGRIAEGPAALIGRIGFALHPHQSAAVVAADAVSLVPEGVPPRRATLAANLETALNIVWDSGASLGDRVLVIGAGVVGLLVARLLSRIAGVEVTLADADPAKRAAAEAMGAAFAAPHSLPADVDVAINATGSDAGLDMAIAAAGLEARIVEASWHGEGTQRVTLGGAFHARRLTIQSSQVGRIPAARAARWTHRRRLATVMRLLEDDALDALISHEVPLAEAPARLPGLLKEPGALGILITYDAQGA